MKKLHVIIVFALVLLLFSTSFYFCATFPSRKPVTGASSPVQTQGDVRPQVTGAVSVTEGAIRVRRRHENDMDFGKFNPFYWQGRHTSFKVEDFTSRNENRVVFTLYNEWPQDSIPTRGPDFSAGYIGDPMAATEATRSKFIINMRMQMVENNRVFRAVLDQGALNAMGAQRGDVITFEFRMFMSESFPDWQRQKQANHHNLSAYYSEFFRIKLGEPGLLIDDPKRANGAGDPLRYAGGKTTTVTPRVEPWRGLGQIATNMRPDHMQSFFWGRTWLHTDMTSGEHVSETADDKPSVFFPGDRVGRAGHQSGSFNVRSCIACHDLNGSKLLPDVGQPIHTTILRTVDTRTGGINPHPSFRQQIQTSGPQSEGEVKILRWDYRTETFADGERVELRSPVWQINSPTDKTGLGYSPRRPMALAGLGLLEAIPEEQIRVWAKENGGTVSMDGTRIGRFGHKSERGTLLDQITSAFNIDLGVTTENSQYIDCANNCQRGKGNLFLPAVNDVLTYVRLVGVPPRLDPTDQAVARGDLVFRRLGCASCHVPSVKTGGHEFPELAGQDIQPFTDLLLHDMGEGLKDFTGNKLARFWRTTPLWSLKDKRASTDARTAQFQPGNINLLWRNSWEAVKGNRIEMLHDSRARTIPEAIFWHSGEAEQSKQAYRSLSKQERQDLEAFIWDL